MLAIVELLNKLFDALKDLVTTFKKSPEEKQKEVAREVDSEQDENIKRGRPSGDFWKK